MSRVSGNNKYMNVAKYDNFITNPSKLVRIHSQNEDFHKVNTLTSWLFIKYNMSYKTYNNKSQKRKNELRLEYVADTGNQDPQDKINENKGEKYE